MPAFHESRCCLLRRSRKGRPVGQCPPSLGRKPCGRWARTGRTTSLRHALTAQAAWEPCRGAAETTTPARQSLRDVVSAQAAGGSPAVGGPAPPAPRRSREGGGAHATTPGARRAPSPTRRAVRRPPRPDAPPRRNGLRAEGRSTTPAARPQSSPKALTMCSSCLVTASTFASRMPGTTLPSPAPPSLPAAARMLTPCPRLRLCDVSSSDDRPPPSSPTPAPSPFPANNCPLAACSCWLSLPWPAVEASAGGSATAS